MKCPYCDGSAELVKGDVIYPARDDLYNKNFYLCKPCNAYVGCHANTAIPLGRLANSELRRWKMAVHAVFDPIWRTGGKSRGGAYLWLRDKMGLTENECHIGKFNVEQCRKAIAICKARNK